MVSHHPANSGSYSHCGRGDIMFLVVGEQDLTCPCLNLPLLFITKVPGQSCFHTRNIAINIAQT